MNKIIKKLKKIKKIKNNLKNKRKNNLKIMIQIPSKKLNMNQQQLHFIIRENMMKHLIKLKKQKIIHKILKSK